MSETKPSKSRREEYSESTRSALLASGRAIFTAEGFQSAGMEAISRSARVTRGAFYYYFPDKKALYDAVVVELQAEAAQKVEQRARSKGPLWQRMREGIAAYLDACLEPSYQRLVIREGAAVLGSARYREIGDMNCLLLLKATFEALKRHSELKCDDVDLLTRMTDAMICEAAIQLAESSDSGALRKRAQDTIEKMLSAFRVDPNAAGT